MSQWATLEADFVGLRESDVQGWPTGSESGPICIPTKDGQFVSGRLRDFHDYRSPLVLAWFFDVCWVWGPQTASLLLDFDNGPRYRYEWSNGEIRKLRGLLDG